MITRLGFLAQKTEASDEKMFSLFGSNEHGIQHLISTLKLFIRCFLPDCLLVQQLAYFLQQKHNGNRRHLLIPNYVGLRRFQRYGACPRNGLKHNCGLSLCYFEN